MSIVQSGDLPHGHRFEIREASHSYLTIYTMMGTIIDAPVLNSVGECISYLVNEYGYKAEFN
jgi:hypothetical protein